MNYIQGLNLNKLFSKPRVWRILFAIEFKDIDLSKIININYNEKDYVYYVILYQGLYKAYNLAIKEIDHRRRRTSQIMKNFLNEHNLSKIEDLTPELKGELAYDLYEYVGHISGTMNQLGRYAFYKESNNFIEIILKSNQVFLGIGIEDFWLYTKNIHDNIVKNSHIKVTYKTAIEFLMYINFHR